jgi:hypothetical protein
MKKCILILFNFFLVFVATAQVNQPSRAKLSPLTRVFIQQLQQANDSKIPKGYLFRKDVNGTTFVSALIKVVNANTVSKSLDQIGAIVGTKAGNIWTVQVPISSVLSFVEIEDIAYIQLDEPAMPNLDIARKTTRVDSVHRGINLPMGYSGKDVVMGVIDFGYDYNHPTFYDTLHSKYRIKKVWEQNGVGTAPAGYNYGNEISDSTLIKAQGTDDINQNHGTSTSGMAAGSGFGGTPNSRFRGMAYEADLVLVAVRRDSIEGQWQQGSFTDFVDGINYIFNYASSVGKPCVINISWGSHSGPHDGSTLMNQAFNNLTGPGKIIVMSAGNEGQEKIHISKTFTPADSTVNSYLTFSSPNYKRTWVDIWGEPGKVFCSEVKLFNNGVFGNTSGLICIDDSIHDQVLISANGTDTCIVKFITSYAEYNGKPRVTIDIFNKSTDTVNVVMSDDSGTINVWNEYYYYGYKYGYQCQFDSLKRIDAISGNNVSTVSDMGAADSVLLVGAYASKISFTDINGSSWSYSGYVAANKLVPFSSRGPLIDGRIKPDITAPGLTIATSVSSYDTSFTPTGSNSALTTSLYFDAALGKSFYYGEFIGTSASAPAASGIVALMLQIKPDLGPKEIQDIIATTAINDVHTSTIPPSGNNNWGHGKINAYKSVKAVLVLTGIYSYVGEKLDCDLFPNPSNGEFILNYSSDMNESLLVEIFSIRGEKIISKNWNVANGKNNLDIDLTDNNAGVYLVKVSSARGFVTIKAVLN